ncbi:hypothetical protein DFAR_630029 [Desulfarculales bacterium]
MAFPTLTGHMPRSYQEHAKWGPERITNWIHKIGEVTAKLAEGIMSRRAHPQQDFRACLSLVTLAKKHGEMRMEVGKVVLAGQNDGQDWLGVSLKLSDCVQLGQDLKPEEGGFIDDEDGSFLAVLGNGPPGPIFL